MHVLPHRIPALRSPLTSGGTQAVEREGAKKALEETRPRNIREAVEIYLAARVEATLL